MYPKYARNGLLQQLERHNLPLLARLIHFALQRHNYAQNKNRYRPVFDLVTKTNQVVVQHFQFGASNKIYSITDLGAKECHLFNETGNSLIDKPIEASQPIEISRKPGADQVFQLITAFENRLSLLEFEKE